MFRALYCGVAALFVSVDAFGQEGYQKPPQAEQRSMAKLTPWPTSLRVMMQWHSGQTRAFCESATRRAGASEDGVSGRFLPFFLIQAW